jgi:hypothetical protein
MRSRAMLVCAFSAIAAAGMGDGRAQSPAEMGFFVTSVGSGKGGDLGGLQGADKHCQSLAAAAGAGGRTWRAYLSTSGTEPVHARERIGKGPWKNARGVVIADSVEQLHGANAISKDTALSEKGEKIPGSADRRGTHDMMTGSTPSGRAFPPERGNRTCSNWTSSGEGEAMVGHHDRMGIKDDDENRARADERFGIVLLLCRGLSPRRDAQGRTLSHFCAAEIAQVSTPKREIFSIATRLEHWPHFMK